jgi:nucleotide-binding universal stress UspA family protein
LREETREMMAHRDWIAVGVDGSTGSKAATRWAAREAERLGLGLLVVHAYAGYHAMGSFYSSAYPLTPVEDRLLPQNILEDAVGEAEKLLPRDRIDTSALHADARAGLLQVAADNRMLVLGDETHPALSRLVTGSVVAPVAAHAPVPVVAVPANWQDAPSHGSVVVGVKNLESSFALVRHAFQLAAAHDATLTLLHAWEYLAQYDDVIAAHATLPEWEQRARDDLGALLARMAPEFPGVQTEIRLVHGQPARVLVDASSETDLLVITRRPHLLPYGHLGGTGRAVLRETRCPTVVLPPVAEPVHLTVSEAGADRLEAEGRAAFSRR